VALSPGGLHGQLIRGVLGGEGLQLSKSQEKQQQQNEDQEVSFGKMGRRRLHQTTAAASALAGHQDAFFDSLMDGDSAALVSNSPIHPATGDSTNELVQEGERNAEYGIYLLKQSPVLYAECRSMGTGALKDLGSREPH